MAKLNPEAAEVRRCMVMELTEIDARTLSPQEAKVLAQGLNPMFSTRPPSNALERFRYAIEALRDSRRIVGEENQGVSQGTNGRRSKAKQLRP